VDSRALQSSSGIRHPASGIRHPASGIRHPASGIRHPEKCGFILKKVNDLDRKMRWMM